MYDSSLDVQIQNETLHLHNNDWTQICLVLGVQQNLHQIDSKVGFACSGRTLDERKFPLQSRDQSSALTVIELGLRQDSLMRKCSP